MVEYWVKVAPRKEQRYVVIAYDAGGYDVDTAYSENLDKVRKRIDQMKKSPKVVNVVVYKSVFELEMEER